MVVAPIAAGREAGLRALLDSMNAAPGMADPRNARRAVRRSSSGCTSRASSSSTMRTAGDLAAHGVEPPRLPTYLVFIGDCDGPARRAARRAGAARAAPGCARIFAHCEGFAAGSRSARLDARARPARRPRATSTGSAAPCGRSARRARCSARWRRACRAEPLAAAGDGAARSRASSSRSSQAEVGARPAGADAAAPTPLGWQLAKLRQPRRACRWSACSRCRSLIVLRAAPRLAAADAREDRPRDLPAPARRRRRGAAGARGPRHHATSSPRSARSSPACSAAGC